MALVLDHESGTEFGIYKRYNLSSGDGMIMDFRERSSNFEDTSTKAYDPNTWSWVADPGSGATITLTFAIRPDYEDDDSFHNYGEFTNGQISTNTGRTEDARVTGFKFEVSGGSAVIEVVTPGPVAVREL